MKASKPCMVASFNMDWDSKTVGLAYGRQLTTNTPWSTHRNVTLRAGQFATANLRGNAVCCLKTFDTQWDWLGGGG